MIQDCIFCKIINGEIPNYTVYEDGQVLAFLDINPLAKGHTVVIPKIHAETLLDLDDKLINHLFLAIKKVMKKLDTKINPDGYNVGWNHGEAGGQVVVHLHVHVIPRWKGDGGGNIHSIVKNPGDMSVEGVAGLFI